MSFSEYNGSKTKVSTAVGRILRNAHENLPKIQNAQGSALGRLLRSISSSNSVSERMRSQQSSHSSLTTSHPSHFSSPSNSSKFGFQKLRLRSGEKKRGTNQHAELLDDQQDQEDSEGEHDDRDPRGDFMPLSNSSLINPHGLSSPATHKPKKWGF